jgi:F-type H+-transporting ATPase subunit delta
MTSAGSFVLAERYARALIDVAIDKKADLDEIGRELGDIAALLAAHPKLAEALSTPAIPAEKRVAVVNDVLARHEPTPTTANLFRLLTIRDRIPIFGVVVAQYQRLLLEHKLIQPGDVTSAHELTQEQQQRLGEGLGRALGKTMELTFNSDPKLVGGLVVRVGNRVYDASVITQLERFKEKALSSL